MIEKIKAPFTPEQVHAINKHQTKGRTHQFTCCSPESIPECTRAVREVGGEIVNGTSDGTLLATTEGLVCPCGKYKQEWVYAEMAAEEERDELFERAAEIVFAEKQCLRSKLQVELKIGYHKADRIIGQMMDAGIVGPYNGAYPRKVLITDAAELKKITENFITK